MKYIPNKPSLLQRVFGTSMYRREKMISTSLWETLNELIDQLNDPDSKSHDKALANAYATLRVIDDAGWIPNKPSPQVTSNGQMFWSTRKLIMLDKYKKWINRLYEQSK